MNKPKVLFVFQEITPYLPESHLSLIGRNLPQGIREAGKEIRTFMPKYGMINERRNQLHEVIRLSGMNLIIDDTDHPLIIKVASIQSARMQVYFIDNEDYFGRKHLFADKTGKVFADNDERSIFFNRGVIETIIKLNWSPDIIHCHGWFSGLFPLYIKKAFHDNPLFTNAKIVYSVYDDVFEGSLDKRFKQKSIINGVNKSDVEILSTPTHENINKLAINFSDGVIAGSKDVSSSVTAHAKEQKVPLLDYQDTSNEDYIQAYNNFYNQILNNDS